MKFSTLRETVTFQHVKLKNSKISSQFTYKSVRFQRPLLVFVGASVRENLLSCLDWQLQQQELTLQVYIIYFSNTTKMYSFSE